VAAEDASNNAGPFSLPGIKALIQLMGRHNVNEIYLRQGDQRIRLRRGARLSTPAAAEDVPAARIVTPAAPASSEAAPPTQPSRVLHEVKSEVVGTFYTSPKPKEPAFVQVGSRVNKGDVLGLIEAMKLFNDVTADRPGVIVEICVQNQQFVEFDQVLFRIDPTG
jgi:acetyl-CoA carboxylase biotin carboxyl carrier protein